MGLLRPARPQGSARVHRHRAGGLDGGEQQRRPGRRGGAGRTPGGGRFPDTPPLSTYNPVVARRPLPRDPARGRRPRPRPLRPAVAGGDPRARRRRAVHGDRAGPGVLRRASSRCRSRSPSTTRCSCRSSAARWRTTAASPGPTRSCAGPRPRPPSTSCSRKVLLHEMAHMWFGNIVTMRWWDDLWLNEAFAEFACNWAAERATRVHRRLGDATSPTSELDGLPRRPGTDRRTRSTSRSPTWPRPPRSSTRSPTPRAPRCCSQLMTLRRRGGVHGRAWRRTSPRTPGATPRCRTSSTRWPRPAAATWTPGATAWLETAGTDRLTLEHGTATGSTLVGARARRAGAASPQVLDVGAYRRTPAGLERIALASVEVDGRADPRRPAARTPTSTWSTTTT